MSEWQTMETAPKDGTPVWIFEPSMYPTQFVASFAYTEQLAKEHEHYWEGWVFEDELCSNAFDGDLKPTHWMPLPAPPETTQ